MPHDARAIANKFLELANREEMKLTPMQIGKLVYIAHGWNLALTGKPLINQRIEAWQYGPVIPDIYHEFKDFGRNPITKPACKLSVDDKSGKMVLEEYHEKLSDREEALVRKVFDVYGHLPAFQLSNLTHKQGTPWSKVWNEGNGCLPRSAVIQNNTIESHFRELANRNG